MKGSFYANAERHTEEKQLHDRHNSKFAYYNCYILAGHLHEHRLLSYDEADDDEMFLSSLKNSNFNWSRLNL